MGVNRVKMDERSAALFWLLDQDKVCGVYTTSLLKPSEDVSCQYLRGRLYPYPDVVIIIQNGLVDGIEFISTLAAVSGMKSRQVLECKHTMCRLKSA